MAAPCRCVVPIETTVMTRSEKTAVWVAAVMAAIVAAPWVALFLIAIKERLT